MTLKNLLTGFNAVRSIPLASAFASLLIALLVYGLTSGLEHNQRSTLAVGAFMISAWVLEAIPFGAVALLPALAFPLLGISSLQSVVGRYATPTVALFFGGFLLASAIERSRVHERIALQLLVRTRLGPKRSLLGILLLSGFLSMWISNTSTAIMLVPLAIALGRSFTPGDGSAPLAAPFALAAAYGANLGGTASILGSPPNGLLAGAVAARGLEPISFADWIVRMMPLWLLLVPFAWGVLIFVFRTGFAREKDLSSSDANILDTKQSHGIDSGLSSRQKRVAAVFFLAVVLWCFLPFVPLPVKPSEIDAIVALFIGLVLFLIPSGESDEVGGGALLNWEDTRGVAWNILLLFGGGLALSAAFESTGLSAGLAAWLSQAGLDASVKSQFFLLSSVLMATEIVSNTALAATVIPILLELEVSQGLASLTLALPATIAVSLAFMMPIATPPNAIAYGIGHVPLSKMLWGGLIMNILCILILLAWSSFL